MKPKYIDITLIENPIKCCLIKSEKKFRKELKRLGIKEKSEFICSGRDATTWTFTRNREVVCIICMSNKNPVSNIALLTHEIMHVWQEIKEALGEEKPSSEFEAYAVQGIIHQLLRDNPWVIKEKL